MPPLVIWLGLIFFLSSRSGFPQTPIALGEYGNILAHFIEYAILSTLAYRTLEAFGLRRHTYALTLFFTIIIALSDEAIQIAIPNRAAELQDVIFDVAGATGVLLILEWRRRRQTRFHSG